jgi:hypothetical protein
MNLNARKAAQPSEPLFSQGLTGRSRHFLECGQKGFSFGD